jgi:sugar-specific transcriptional regulator TrmB
VKASELVDRLTEFEIDERQAHVFFHLSRLGPSTASEVAEATEVSRTEIYRVMQDLESLGFVETTLERPRKFVPNPIEQVLGQRLEVKRQEVDELEEVSETLADRWPRTEEKGQARKQRFSVHQGRSQVQGLLDRMIENASEEVLLLAPSRGLSRLDNMGVLDDLVEQAEDDVDLRALTEIDEPSEPVDVLGEAGQVRHVDLPGYAQLVVVDRDEIALFVTLDPLVSTQGTGETVLWLNARDFILSQKGLFDTLWSMGIRREERLDALENDSPAERVEVIRGRWTQFGRMKEMLHRAENEVRLMAPDVDLERWTEGHHADALDRAREQVDEVTILGPDAVEGNPEATVLEVDGEEALFATGVEREPDSSTFRDEWGVRVTTEEGVALLTRLFEERARAVDQSTGERL